MTARAPSVGGRIAWALFDGARAPYNVLVNIFVFSAYFATVVVPDSVHGQVLWTFVGGVVFLAVGLALLLRVPEPPAPP